MVRHALVLTALVLLAGCVNYNIASPEPKLAKDFEKHPEMSKAMLSAESLVLYEGLPHQAREVELYKHELATKETVRLDGFDFYVAPIEVSTDDAKRLVELHASLDAVKALRQDEPCGKFHPDFALVGKVGEEPAVIHFCFGCGEVLTIIGDEKMYSDMTGEGEEMFGDVLWKYAKNRPPAKKLLKS